MANAIYPKFKEACLDGTAPDLTDGNLKCVLVDTDDYSYNAAHNYFDDVAAGARVAEIALANVDVTDGELDHDDPTFSSVTGDESEALVYYYDDGAGDAASELVAYIDTGVTGLPVTPNGDDINLTVNGSYAFKL